MAAAGMAVEHRMAADEVRRLGAAGQKRAEREHLQWSGEKARQVSPEERPPWRVGPKPPAEMARRDNGAAAEMAGRDSGAAAKPPAEMAGRDSGAAAATGAGRVGRVAASRIGRRRRKRTMARKKALARRMAARR